MWWLPLAMAAGKSVMDNQNNKQNLASNVITQKYSPWTGAQADFSAQGKNSFADNMIKGGAGAMMQYGAEKAAAGDAMAAKTQADKASGDFYASNGDLMRGDRGNSIAAKSSFNVPSRAPATIVAPQSAPQSPASFASMFPVQTQGQTPLMLQGQNPDSQENLWMKMIQQGGMR
jgi:hypothetical protein